MELTGAAATGRIEKDENSQRWRPRANIELPVIWGTHSLLNRKPAGTETDPGGTQEGTAVPVELLLPGVPTGAECVGPESSDALASTPTD